MIAQMCAHSLVVLWHVMIMQYAPVNLFHPTAHVGLRCSTSAVQSYDRTITRVVMRELQWRGGKEYGRLQEVKRSSGRANTWMGGRSWVPGS